MATTQLNAETGEFEHQVEVGPVKRAGSCVYDGKDQVYRMQGSGANIWGEEDAFHFSWKRMCGNFIVTMQATFNGKSGNPHRKAGWMARTKLEAGSAHVSSVVHANGLVALQYRRRQAGPTDQQHMELTGADVIQLERCGNLFCMSAARFGEPFQQVQVREFEIEEELYVGLFVCAHAENEIEEVNFHNVRMVIPVQDDFDRSRDPLGSTLELLEVQSGKRKIIQRSGQVLEAPNWTRDGQALIYNKDGRLVRFDLATGITNLIESGQAIRNNNDHVLSFDGSRLGISNHSEQDGLSRIYTLPVEGGKPKQITALGPSYLHGWSPDGKFLVFTGQRNGQFDIYRIPVEAGLEQQLTDTTGLDDGPEYTPDGKYIYFNSVRSGRMQIWRMKADGSGQEQITDDEFNNWFPHISPDGKWVAFISYPASEAAPGDHPPAKRVLLRRLPLEGGTSKVMAYLYGGQGSMNVASWSPDGSQLAFVSYSVPQT